MIDGASVHSREVVEEASKQNAAAVVLDHIIVARGDTLSMTERGLI